MSVITIFEPEEWLQIHWAGLDLVARKTVFQPRQSSIFIPPIVAEEAGIVSENAILLDLCCGTGALGIKSVLLAPRRFCKLIALDNAASAVESARRNMEAAGIRGTCLVWNAGEPIKLDAPAVAICNPPYMPLWSEKITEQTKTTSSHGDGTDIIKACFKSLQGIPILVFLKSLDIQLSKVERDISSNFQFLHTHTDDVRHTPEKQILSVWRSYVD